MAAWTASGNRSGEAHVTPVEASVLPDSQLFERGGWGHSAAACILKQPVNKSTAPLLLLLGATVPETRQSVSKWKFIIYIYTVYQRWGTLESHDLVFKT